MNSTPVTLHVAESGAGRTVLMLHGQPGIASDWDLVTTRLEGAVHVMVPDRPGYGRTTEPVATMAGNAQRMATLLEERDCGRAIVVAHSYAGGIAALLASGRPDLVAGLVLVSSVGAEGCINSFDRMLALPGLGPALSAAAFLTVGHVLPRLRPLAARLPLHASDRILAGLPDDSYTTSISGLGLRMTQSFVAEQRFLLSEIAQVEQSFASITVPTSVICGTLDTIVPPVVGAILAATIPGAKLLLVARKGHFVPRDAPQLLAREVMELITATT
ncbi:MAG: alpha/beta fold hydrolase [Acidimicrobiales bacterium]